VLITDEGGLQDREGYKENEASTYNNGGGKNQNFNRFSLRMSIKGVRAPPEGED